VTVIHTSLPPLNIESALDAASKHLVTVRDVVRFAVSRFAEAGLAFGHGNDSALDEAAYLVCHALALPLDRLEAFLDARLLPEEVDRTLGLIRRRVVERIPAAYLTGEAFLGEYRFSIDERVIVPRSYIAHWLMADMSPWLPSPEDIHDALELCTGSGCLAILMALALEDARVVAVDISEPALQVAQRNVADYGLDQRIDLRRGDLFDAIEASSRFDLIVTNPPYVNAESMARLPAEYRHEPQIALAGGDDGLELVRRILAHARRHLRPGGTLVVEVGHARDVVEAAFPDLPFTWLDVDGVDDAVFLLTREQLPQ
jgi:ribosomal protein L3 glutamine methyltransferase